jgi:hypothetical protein
VNACTWKPSLVTLHDGRQVLSDSEEYRHECEARTVIAMRGQVARRAYLRGKLDDNGTIRGGVLQKRGEAACERLEHTIKQIWYSNTEASK